MGRYSKAPRSVARTAVSRVDCALMTMMRRSGRSLRMRGTRSRPFSSGITTSVMTSWPSPSWTHCHSVAAAPVLRTLWPWRPSAWCRTVRIARSSSAMRMVVALLMGRPAANCNGSITLKVVRPGSLSNSMAPPWSLMILATRARPRPVPVGLLVTKASNRWARISSDTPRPLSRTDTTRGRLTLRLLAGHGQPQAVPVGGRQLDLALAVARHLAGVLHQVQEHLDQLVAVAEARRAATGS